MDENVSEPIRVFISYTHDTKEHKKRVLDYANWLNQFGIDCWIDRYVENINLPIGMIGWMRRQIKESKYVLVVGTELYQKRMDYDEEQKGKGMGSKFEGTLILNEFYNNESLNSKFIPVIFEENDRKWILDFLTNQTFYNIENPERREDLYARMTNQQQILKPEVGAIKKLPLKSTLTQLKSVPEDVENIEEIINMQPGTKLVQAYLRIPFSKRFALAQALNVVEAGESLECDNPQNLSSLFLKRMHDKNLLAILWSKLFDEEIDPNPFKK